ncbi:hypothetical protein Ancab_030531 [Ancistrocladus abbreviatus]
MASTTTEYQKQEAAAPPAPPPPAPFGFSGVDVFLRFLLLAAAIVAVVVMVTGKETELVQVAGVPFPVSLPAKFNYSPAFIYFVAAFSTAGLYAIITILASLSLIRGPVASTKLFLVLAANDAIMLGIVASATGAAAAVGYLGFKGNSHVGWVKVCHPHMYSKYCRHVGGSLGVALFASILLVILVILNTTSLYLRMPKY